MNQLVAWVDSVDSSFYCFGVKHKSGITKCFEIFTDYAFDMFGNEICEKLEKCKEPTPIDLILNVDKKQLECNCGG